jgi:acetyltransferase-like isoleucine patch superfamily enzyme
MNSMMEQCWEAAGRHPRIRLGVATLASIFGGNRRRGGGGWTLLAREALLNRVVFDVEGTGHAVEISAGARLERCRIRMRGANHRLVIGEDCRIRDSAFCLEDEGGYLGIGRDTTTEGMNVAVTESGSRITIGKDCMIAFDVDIRCGDSHAILDRATGRRLNAAKDIVIGDHVWIGARAAILKGAVIGNESVIGIQSVVTGDIPDCVVAAGVPARVIRENIAWTRQRGLQ